MEEEQEAGVPPWTLFFEGTLYRRYLQYMRNHDLSKAVNNGSIMTNKNTPLVDPPILSNETNWVPSKKFDNEAGYPDYNEYNYNSEKPNNEEPPPYDQCLTKPQRRRRNRQTCGYIIFGILFLGAAAAATALIIHYVFIENRERITNDGRIHIPRNGSSEIFDDKTLELITEDINSTTTAKTKDDKLDSTTIDPLAEIETVLKPVNTENGDTVSTGDIIKVVDSTTPSDTKAEVTTPDTQTVTETPKLINFPDYEYEVGETGLLKCKFHRVRIWDSVYINGTQDSRGQGEPLSCRVLSNGRTCFNTKDKRITEEVNIMDQTEDGKFKNIEISIRFENIHCLDAGTFICGIDGPDKAFVQAELSVIRKPDKRPTLKIPISVIENESITISARWGSGYPSSLGELEWFEIPPGSNTEKPMSININSLKPYPDKCKNDATSFVMLNPDLSFNGTKIKVIPKTQYPVEAIVEEILVVPANYCDGKNREKINHPYTCQKFIRCTQQMTVFPCKEGTCFDEDRMECV